jgi:hypothetical protein
LIDFKDWLKKKVEITMKDGTVVSGVLKMFDMHTNILLEQNIFIRGDSIQMMALKEKEK